jgi:23S rRNA pseudouridine955/2504/2580 synthase
MSVIHRDVTEDEADIRLDRWLRRHYPVLTQGMLQKLCRTGQVRVDGSRAETSLRLRPGQSVRIPPLPSSPPPPPPQDLDPATLRELDSMVLYMDDSVIVVNKPAGLPVQGGPGIIRHLDGMLDGLRNGALDRPRLVHRIDMDTSGLLVLARSPGSAAKLAAAFRSRHVEKTYWAVVAGRPEPSEGRIDRALVRFGGLRGGERTAIAAPGEADASRAITEYKTMDHASKRLAWLALYPHTGRTHQLRVHCASLGTPILGDRKYGGETAQLDGFADRLHLHARALTLPHPSGGTLSLEAEIPPHMRATFERLGFEAGQAKEAVLFW